jgi:hypothetical protein
MRRFSLWLVVGIFVLSVCTGFWYWQFGPNVGRAGITTDGVGLSGFQTFPTPRTFDGPGTIFRITPDQVRFAVVNLKVPVEKAGKEIFANYHKTNEWSLASILKFMGASKLFGDAQVSVDLGSDTEVTLNIGEGNRERTYDGDVDSSLRVAAIDYRKDSRYYIIRETISVSQISYRFGNERNLTAGLNAAIKKLVETTNDLKWKGAQQTELVQHFDGLHRIFYTAEEIVAPTGVVGSQVQRRRVTEPLQWTNEQQ